MDYSDQRVGGQCCGHGSVAGQWTAVTKHRAGHRFRHFAPLCSVDWWLARNACDTTAATTFAASTYPASVTAASETAAHERGQPSTAALGAPAAFPTATVVKPAPSQHITAAEPATSQHVTAAEPTARVERSAAAAATTCSSNNVVALTAPIKRAHVVHNGPVHAVGVQLEHRHGRASLHLSRTLRRRTTIVHAGQILPRRVLYRLWTGAW